MFAILSARGDCIGKLLKIGELAKESGLTKRTIDYYTRIGLLEVSTTEENGYRKYGEHNLETIKMIEFYKTKNFTLKEIKCKIEILNKFSENDIRKKIEKILKKLEEAEAEISELKTLTSNHDKIKTMLMNSSSEKSIKFLLEIL